MTSVAPDGRREALFIADFHPRLGGYLARRHETGYDAAAGRTRFAAWLTAHTGDPGDAGGDDGDGGDAGGDGDALREYVAWVGQVPQLTADEETWLAKRIQAGRRAVQALGREPTAEELAAEL